MTGPERQILIVAGEASSDRYAARLVDRLRADAGPIPLRFVGTGGDRMKAAGVELVRHIRELASIGALEAVSHLPAYYQTFRSLVREARSAPTSVAVLLDFPDFNLPLARKMRRCGIPVIYYVSPQLWAWRRGRVRTVRKCVDRMMVILPFEEEFYRNHGVGAEFVGHPLLEELDPPKDPVGFRARWNLSPDLPTIAILPGSRWREVEYILPVLLRAGRDLAASRPVQFAVSVAPSVDAGRLRAIVAGTLAAEVRGRCFRMVTGDSRDLLANCDFGWVKSGTSTLEAALVGTPFLIVYRLSWLSWQIGKILIRSPHKGLVNLIAGESIVPEFMQGDLRPETIARTTIEYLDSAEKSDRMRRRLAGIRAQLGCRRASEGVARAVGGYLGIQYT